MPEFKLGELGNPKVYDCILKLGIKAYVYVVLKPFYPRSILVGSSEIDLRP
jgi:hypothetical protein